MVLSIYDTSSTIGVALGGSDDDGFSRSSGCVYVIMNWNIPPLKASSTFPDPSKNTSAFFCFFLADILTLFTFFSSVANIVPHQRPVVLEYHYINNTASSKYLLRLYLFLLLNNLDLYFCNSFNLPMTKLFILFCENRSSSSFKLGLSPIYLMMKNNGKNDEKYFLFHLKNPFVPKVFSFFSWLFGHVEKMAWSER